MKIISVRLKNAARVNPKGGLGSHVFPRPNQKDVITKDVYGITAQYEGETNVYSTPWANVLDWTEVNDESKRHSTSAKDVPGTGVGKQK